MEAHKERCQQLHRMKLTKNKDYGNQQEETTQRHAMDPTTKKLVQESITKNMQEGEKGHSAEKSDDVLAFARSVNKVDSSLE
ncbi:hypothetical protein ACHQM5_030499 [Ranunculus cassubicifolius]